MPKALLMMEVYRQTRDMKAVRFYSDYYALWSEERRALES